MIEKPFVKVRIRDLATLSIVARKWRGHLCIEIPLRSLWLAARIQGGIVFVICPHTGEYP
jgi:hypothetical protein